MIKNRWVFDDDYETPILHRHNELRSLSRLLNEMRYTREGKGILIHGSSGVGKTASARWMLDNLRDKVGLEWTTIECSGMTRNEILYEAVTSHPNHGVVHKNQPAEELIEALRSAADDAYVLMLDEADAVPERDILVDLFAVDCISVVAISHQHVEWLNRVDRNIRPRFRGEASVEFRKYHVSELVDILEPRVKHGLIGRPVSNEQLETIADQTSGVARWAIKSVLAAGELAYERGHDAFRDEDVADSFERAKAKIREANLRSLPPEYGRMYELVRMVGPVTGEEMKTAYHEHKDRIFVDRPPVGWRQAWNYLSKLADYDLIEMPGETNSTVYKVVDEELEAPVEFEVSGVTTSLVDL